MNKAAIIAAAAIAVAAVAVFLWRSPSETRTSGPKPQVAHTERLARPVPPVERADTDSAVATATPTLTAQQADDADDAPNEAQETPPTVPAAALSHVGKNSIDAEAAHVDEEKAQQQWSQARGRMSKRLGDLTRSAGVDGALHDKLQSLLESELKEERALAATADDSNSARDRIRKTTDDAALALLNADQARAWNDMRRHDADDLPPPKE